MTARRRSIARLGTATLAQVALLGPLPLTLTLVQDWYVDASAPGCPGGSGTQADPFCTIQEAVDAATDGDTIHIAPGTYFENVVIEEDLSLIGTGGQEVTVLDGVASGSVVHVRDSVTSLTGLTLTNGMASVGGGLNAESTVGGDGLPVVTLTSCTVSGNSAGTSNDPFSGVGGGLYSSSDGVLRLEGSTVHSNSAGEGGGVHGAVILDRSLVTSNSAFNGGGVYGGVEAIHSVISDNVASNNGGGVTAPWSGPSSSFRVTLVSSRVSGNRALSGEGGAIGCYGGCGSHGGCSIPSIAVINSLVVDNQAPFAGGIWAHGEVTITNSTVTRNSSSLPVAGGLIAELVGGYGYSSVSNSIFFDNGAVSIHVQQDFLVVEHSLVEGGWPGTGNFDADPLFVDPLNGDYRLQPGSPCIDAGGNSAVPFWINPLWINTDLRGAPRFLDDPFTPDSGVGPGPVVDLGAFEFLRRARSASGVPVPTGPTRSVP